VHGTAESINRKEGKGILLISHNLNLAANYADKLIFLKEGSVLGMGLRLR
jgi:iron complex transport system ATP-binding protein